MKYVFVRHQQKGVYFSGVGGSYTLTHCQIRSCSNAVAGAYATLYLRNGLLNECYYMTDLIGSTLLGENVTIDNADGFGVNLPTLVFTNCLISGIASGIPSFSGSYNSTGTVAGVFHQAAGAGSHYLAAGSTNRNSGTTGINANLLADLRKKSTHPPIILSNTVITIDTTLVPQAQRDTDAVDRGWHAEPLDYAFYQVKASNINLVVKPGVAIATAGSYGLALDYGAHLYVEGTPLQMVEFTHYLLVQEHARTNWDTGYWGAHLATPWWTVGTPPEASVRFARFTFPSGSGQHLYADAYASASLAFRDCQFFNGSIYDMQPSLLLSNCLFARTLSQVYQYDVNTVSLRHSTTYGGTVDWIHADLGPWTVRDSIFDRATVYYDNATANHDYNGFPTGSDRLLPTNIHDVVLTSTNIAYEATALSRFYLPTNVTAPFDSGSTNAHRLGLWPFTSDITQRNETNSVVNLGFHLPALHTNLTVLALQDSDGDGIPDYMEDLDGDGVFDVGTAETDYTNYNSPLGIGTNGTGLTVFTPLR